MDTVVIDNSAQVYPGAMPDEREGKFVQLTDGTRQVIVFSPIKLHPYHANIAEAFLRQEGITKGSYNSKRDHFNPVNTGWQILGGGTWRVIEKEKQLSMGGASQAYGPFIEEGLREIMESSPAFKGYKVKIQ